MLKYRVFSYTAISEYALAILMTHASRSKPPVDLIAGFFFVLKENEYKLNGTAKSVGSKSCTDFQMP